MRDVGFWSRGSVHPQPILCRGDGFAETPWNGFPGKINSSLLGGSNTASGVNIKYTAQSCNGVSALIGRRPGRILTSDWNGLKCRS